VLTKVHHIGVAVRSAEEALGLYRDALGLQVTKDEVLAQQGVRGVLLSAGETEIELLEPTRRDSAVARFLASRGEGLHHLCFATDDIDSELAAARERDLPLIDERPRPGLAGMIAFIHPRATRGVLIEYAQPPTDGEAQAAQPVHGVPAPVFDHVAVAVSDLDAGARVFARNFAIAETERNEWPVLGIRAATLPIGGGWIGVVSPLTPHTAVARFIENRGEGLYLISLAVARLDQALGALEERGVGCTEPISAAGSKMAFIRPRGSNGALIQLMERGS